MFPIALDFIRHNDMIPFPNSVPHLWGAVLRRSYLRVAGLHSNHGFLTISNTVYMRTVVSPTHWGPKGYQSPMPRDQIMSSQL